MSRPSLSPPFSLALHRVVELSGQDRSECAMQLLYAQDWASRRARSGGQVEIVGAAGVPDAVSVEDECHTPPGTFEMIALSYLGQPLTPRILREVDLRIHDPLRGSIPGVSVKFSDPDVPKRWLQMIGTILREFAPGSSTN